MADCSPLTPYSEQLYYFSWNLPEKFSLTQTFSMENFSLSSRTLAVINNWKQDPVTESVKQAELLVEITAVRVIQG